VKLGNGPDDQPDGPNYKKAFDAWYDLVNGKSLSEAGDDNRLRDIANEFLTTVAETLRPATVRSYKYHLGILVAKHGTRQVKDFKPIHLREIIRERRKPRLIPDGRTVRWNDSTVSTFTVIVKTCLNWAVSDKLIKTNPIADMEQPPQKTKSRDRTLLTVEKKIILERLKPPHYESLRNIILALDNTGARPGELINAKVSDFDSKLRAIVYYADDCRREDEFAHKNSGRQKTRFIIFSGEVLELVRRLARSKGPDEFLFPTRKGKQYSGHNLDHCIKRIGERAGIPWLVPYTYRHTFATNWLREGKGVEKLAVLLGNSPQTIQRHYNHLLHLAPALWPELEDFNRTNRP